MSRFHDHHRLFTIESVLGDKIELVRGRFISKGHMAINVVVVDFLGLNGGPDTGISAPDDISKADQIILG